MTLTTQEVPKIQLLYRASIVRGSLNPRTEIRQEGLADLRASFEARGFDAAVSHLLVREIPQDLRIEVGNPLAELNGEELPYRVEKKNPAGEWEVLVRCATEEVAAEELVKAARFELIAGERRWLVSGDLDLEMVPAVVKQMSDAEVLETMLIENLQREGLTPMQEAMGFKNLLEMRDAEGKPLYTAKLIADRVGRTKMHVSRRLALLAIQGTEAAAAMEAGTMPLRCAELIAKLPTAEMREEVTHKVLNNPFGPSPMDRDQLELMIATDYQRDLRGAPFSLTDAGLVPVREEHGAREAGGACDDCPLREVKQAGRHATCLNPRCYQEKVDAAYDAWAASVTDEAKGRAALGREEAARIWDDISGKHLAEHSPYIDLAERPAKHLLRAEVDVAPTWKKILGDQSYAAKLAKDAHGTVHELVFRRNAETLALSGPHGKLFREYREEMPPAPAASEESSPADRAVAAEKREENRAQAAADAARNKVLAERTRIMEAAEEAKLFAAACETTATGTKAFSEVGWELVFQAVIVTLDEADDAQAIALQMGMRKPEAAPSGWENAVAVDFLRRHARKLPVKDRFGFLIALVIRLQSLSDDGRKKWAKAIGVDLKAVRKPLEAKFAEEDKKAKEIGDIAGGLRWAWHPGKFTWNEHNVCADAQTCLLALPKVNGRMHAEIRIAQSEKGWHYGIDFQSAKGGQFFAPSKNGTAYCSRILAVVVALQHIIQAAKAENWDVVHQAAFARLEAYLARVKEQPEVAADLAKQAKAGKSATAKKDKPKAKQANLPPPTDGREIIFEDLRAVGERGLTAKELGLKHNYPERVMHAFLMATAKKDKTLDFNLSTERWSFKPAPPAKGKKVAKKGGK